MVTILDHSLLEVKRTIKSSVIPAITTQEAQQLPQMLLRLARNTAGWPTMGRDIQDSENQLKALGDLGVPLHRRHPPALFQNPK